MNINLLNRVGRIKLRLKPHLKSIRKDAPKGIKKEAENKYSSFNKVYKRVRLYILFLNISFVLLYASAVSAILGDVFLIGEAATFLAQAGGVLGATVLLIAIAILTRLIILESVDAQFLASEIVAIDVKFRK